MHSFFFTLFSVISFCKVSFFFTFLVCCIYKFKTLNWAILSDRNGYLANSFKLAKRIQGLHESTRKLVERFLRPDRKVAVYKIFVLGAPVSSQFRVALSGLGTSKKFMLVEL